MNTTQHRGKLIEIFMEKNSQLNLSAIRNPEGIFVKHIQDSLEINEIIKIPAKSKVLDVGTGSGFPLLPLAMTNPESQFTGIDSIGKKVRAINEMIDKLGLKNAHVERWRVESFKGNYDFITARAVAYIDKLINRTFHLLKPGGQRILMKKVDEEEKQMLLEICKKRKIKLIAEYRYQLFVEDIWRVIWIIKKE